MSKPFSDLRGKMSPESQAAATERAKELGEAMSDPRLEAIRARLEKVSDWPWHQEFGADREKYGFRVYDVRGWGVCKPTKGHAAQDEANSDFIVEAPADVAYLLALIDTLQRERDELKEALGAQVEVGVEIAENHRRNADLAEAQVSRLTETNERYRDIIIAEGLPPDALEREQFGLRLRTIQELQSQVSRLTEALRAVAERKHTWNTLQAMAKEALASPDQAPQPK